MKSKQMWRDDPFIAFNPIINNNLLADYSVEKSSFFFF